ncbi:hypothetical protein [Porcipelethomonas sp.]|uniref:hypothetical protein n=1 Tax=Porcipelethomonas sp. TaxID=2981675 RepID=UPI003EF5BC6C
MVNDIIEEIKKGLTGEPQKDAVYLQEQAIKYKDHENANEIMKILSDMTFNLLPEDKQELLKKSVFIDGKRIDQVFNEADKLVREKKLEGAVKLIRKIEAQADKYFADNDKCNQFSFRNPFDEYLYTHIYKPEKRYERTPFDFCTYLTSLGYLLVELHRPQEAVPVLEKAIKYNPVNVGPRFELAETFKLLLEPEKLFACVRDTLPIASTPEDIARCYCNLGFYCIEIKDYESAVCFYYESLLYAPNDAVTGELHHVGMLMGKKVAPPTRKEVLDAFEKYKIKNGPDKDLVNIAYSLGEYCVEHNSRPEEALFYYSIVYGLTRDENVKKKMDDLNAKRENK